jgi:hypothetical protein
VRADPQVIEAYLGGVDDDLLAEAQPEPVP